MQITFYSFRVYYNVTLLCSVVSLCQNIRDLTPLTHEVISRQATINIGLSLSQMACLLILYLMLNFYYYYYYY